MLLWRFAPVGIITLCYVSVVFDLCFKLIIYWLLKLVIMVLVYIVKLWTNSNSKTKEIGSKMNRFPKDTSL